MNFGFKGTTQRVLGGLSTKFVRLNCVAAVVEGSCGRVLLLVNIHAIIWSSYNELDLQKEKLKH